LSGLVDPFAGLPRRHFGLIAATDMLEVGKAAEHLVCADLILAGYRAFLSDQGLPYDVVVDAGRRLVRIQVKSTIKPKNANTAGRSPNWVYHFHARRRGKGAKGERLSEAHCDLLAFVALDIRTVAYLPVRDVGQTVSLFPPGYRFQGKYKRSRFASIEGFGIEGALAKC
jgi:hypothetical protein